MTRERWDNTLICRFDEDCGGAPVTHGYPFTYTDTGKAVRRYVCDRHTRERLTRKYRELLEPIKSTSLTERVSAALEGREV